MERDILRNPGERCRGVLMGGVQRHRFLKPLLRGYQVPALLCLGGLLLQRCQLLQAGGALLHDGQFRALRLQ